MTKRPTKKLLLNAAVKNLALRGFSSVSMESVADEVGIRPSAAYKHYKNQRELFETAIEDAGQPLLKFVESLCENKRKPLDSINKEMKLEAQRLLAYGLLLDGPYRQKIMSDIIIPIRNMYAESDRDIEKLEEVLERWLGAALLIKQTNEAPI